MHQIDVWVDPHVWDNPAKFWFSTIYVSDVHPEKKEKKKKKQKKKNKISTNTTQHIVAWTLINVLDME